MSQARIARTRRPRRDAQRGAIAIIVALLLATLFGLAAFAVDAGYGYTNKRSLQAAADAAVRAGMPSLRTSSSTAISNATSMATANGYTTGGTTTVTVTTPTSQQLKVVIGISQPTFFARAIGYNALSINATAIGQLSSTTLPAIHANVGCGVGVGATINGGGNLRIVGDVESNGILRYYTGPATTNTSGAVQSPCGGSPAVNSWDNVAGGVLHTGPFADPLSSVTAASFTCTVGNLSTAMNNIPYSTWVQGSSCDTLPPGVYCSSGSLNISPVGSSQAICANNVTFVATGQITIGANNGGTLSPSPTAPRSIIAFTTANIACGSSEAINLGFNNFTMNGVFYAPNGCINAGGANMTLNGSLIANEVQLGDYGAWTIDSGGSGSGAGWTMFQ